MKDQANTRHAVRGYFFDRSGAARPAYKVDQLARLLRSQGHTFDQDEVRAATLFLTEHGHLRTIPGDLGGPDGYQITNEGILAEERLRQGL